MFSRIPNLRKNFRLLLPLFCSNFYFPFLFGRLYLFFFIFFRFLKFFFKSFFNFFVRSRSHFISFQIFIHRFPSMASWRDHEKILTKKLTLCMQLNLREENENTYILRFRHLFLLSMKLIFFFLVKNSLSMKLIIFFFQ